MRYRPLFPLMLLALTLYRLPAPVQGAVTHVWALNDGEKVYRFEVDHLSKSGNSVWDGSKVRLRGLRNEVLAFQVIVETDSFGAKAIEVSLELPSHHATGKTIGGTSAPRYGKRGTVEVYTEHYIEVTKPTPKGWFYGSDASAPPRPTGWIPDPLVPPHALPGRGGFPVDIEPAGARSVRRSHELEAVEPAEVQNQGFWVDVYLPRDESFPSGLYQGAVLVTSLGREISRLPLEITLLDGYLPDEEHSTVWLYTSGVDRYFEGLPGHEVERMIKHAAHRHRVQAVGGFSSHRRRFDAERMEEYKAYLDGSAFTPASGYNGPGQGQGESVFPIGMYGSPVMGDTREMVQRESNLWVHWFEKNAPHVRYFWYLVDEPGPSYYDWIRERGSWIDENPGPGGSLPVFTTRGYTEELADVIDFWCQHNGVDLDRLDSFREKNKGYCFYNGFRPRYGAVLLEAEAVDFRVNAWARYIHQVDIWFLWHGTHWTHNHQGPKANLHQRVFSNPVTYLSSSMTGANGDGIVFYPGRMPFYPDEDRGINELLPSIRLKNIRRGQQDFEIMWLAEQKVGRERVLEIVRDVVPASLEADVGGPVQWSQRGDDFDAARQRLLDLLEE